MKFTTPAKVYEVVQYMQTNDRARSTNRARINSLFNGNPPFTDEQALADNVHSNFNALEGTTIAHAANRQFSNAFLKPGNFFTVKLDGAPPHKRTEWSGIITRELNKKMKASAMYMNLLRQSFASVVLHGIGPSIWEDEDRWCPRYIGIDDCLVPSKTLLDLSNLTQFAVYREYTPQELFRMTHGKVVDKGWNLPLVNKVLAAVKQETQQTDGNLQALTPEKLEERYKANPGWFDSDAVPVVKTWRFFHLQEDDNSQKWVQKIILEQGELMPVDTQSRTEFLYDSDSKYADKLSHLLHAQFGDLSLVAPFRWHTVRSLGFMVYAICYYQNMLRCRMTDAAFEQTMWYFRVNNDTDLGRLNKIDLHHVGIIPDGLQFVTGQERYNLNHNFVMGVMQQNRQLMADNSSSYTSDYDTGAKTAMTATETMVRAQQGQQLVSSMLGNAYNYANFQYKEIGRRFTRKDSRNIDVKDFRRRVMEAGVPEAMIDIERWDIEPERVLGGGNKVLEIAQADKLMAARPLYDQDAQREILHIYTEANTDDPKLAEALVPMKKQDLSDAFFMGQIASGSLMDGLPVGIKQGINHVDYVDAMLQSIESVIQRIEQQQDGMATEAEIVGLNALIQHATQHVQIIAQDEAEGERVNQYMSLLGNAQNYLKAYAQRLAEQMEAQAQQGGGITPEAQAKIQSMLIIAQSTAKIKEAQAQQKLRQNQEKFAAAEARKEVQQRQKLAAENVQVQADVASKDLQTQAEIMRQNAKPKAQ